MSKYHGKTATALTAFVRTGAYAVLATLHEDGTWRTRADDGADVVHPSSSVIGTMHAGTAAADRGAWGRGIRMVRLERMGLFGLAMLGEAQHRSVFADIDAVLTEHPNIRDLSDEDKGVIRSAWMAALES
jgi:hypothetical protein